MIKLHYDNNTNERILTVYDVKSGVYFCRPLFGIEKDLYDHQVVDRIQQRLWRWRMPRATLIDMIFSARGV